MPKKNTVGEAEDCPDTLRSPEDIHAYYETLAGHLMGALAMDTMDVRVCTAEVGKRLHFRMAYELLRAESADSPVDWMKLSTFLKEMGLVERITRVEGRWVEPFRPALAPTN